MILSYHGDPILKSRFVGHVERHRQQDMILKGTYGDERDGTKFRGCAVGCSLRSLNEIDGEKTLTNDHTALARRLGIPLVLARLEDRIFEGLPGKEALIWPTLFAQAIPVGADMSLVWPRFAHWLLVDPAAGVLRFAKTDRVRDAINGVAALFARQIAGGVVSLAEWQRARAAAYAADAADASAAAAADASAASASAASAAAASAASSADAYAAAAAARYRHFRIMAEALLRFMSEAKEPAR